MNAVDRCPYCLGTQPHQGPTGCPPIVWPRQDRRADAEQLTLDAAILRVQTNSMRRISAENAARRARRTTS